jgi:C1A family cysteine protease
MKNIFLGLVLFFGFSGIAFGEISMEQKAKLEGWTFHFNSKAPKFKTGYKKAKIKLDTRSSYLDLTKTAVEIPDVYDLRDKISPIRNQASCGSCWSFSANATVRDAYRVKGLKDPEALSEQYNVDCDNRYYGCNGGDFPTFDLFVAPLGARSLAQYPYTARNGVCRAQSVKEVAPIKAWHYIGSPTRHATVEEIQKAILLYGPASVSVGADRYFQSYRSGVYNACTQAQVNHMTNIVGWNNTEKYWIMRNSWGEQWGEKGFMRIKFTDSKGRLCNRLGDEAAIVEVE